MSETTNPYETLTPAQRSHLVSLLQEINDAEIKAAVEVIFMRGLHDYNNLRFVVQDDIREFTAGIRAELAGLRGDISGLRGVVGQLDNGLTIAEHLTAIITEQELLPAVRGLRDDIAHLVKVIGTPPEDDPRPVLERQIVTEHGLSQLRGQVAWLAPVAVVASVALLLAAAAVLTLILQLEPTIIAGLAAFLHR